MLRPMFGNDDRPDRGPPSSLRGWLSDVYFPAVVDDELGPLSVRLGPRATVDDPLFGRTTGLPALDGLLKQVREWVVRTSAVYTRGQFTTGIDRDVTEGSLSLEIDGSRVNLPVAVVAERRRSREVELRIYYATGPLKAKGVARSALVAHNNGLVLPPLVVNHLEAMRKGSIDLVVACFEADATVTDPAGTVRANAGGDLRAYYEKLLAGGWEAHRGGAADDGRTCAVELSLTKRGGDEISPHPGLLIYEKGDSGLLRAVRVYDDV